MATVILSLVKEIGKLLWDPIKRHFSYLLCYCRNVDTLMDEVNKLEQREKEVKQDVDDAHRKGQVIRHEVEQWLTRADNMKSKKQGVVDRSEHTNCWNGCCWNPILCHELGKEAAELIISVRELRNEGNFDRVSRSPPPPRAESLLSNRGFQLLPTTEETMNSVFNALEDDEINIIGVHGMGGVGKTTLMKEVAKQAERDGLNINKVIMVTVSQTVIIQKIQNEIKEQLGLKIEEESILVRAAKLLARLKKEEKLLVILDDLWEELELSDVGIPCGDADKGCKIVITSRSADVCNRMIGSQGSQTKGCKIEVKPLLEEESWNLFRAKVGDVVNSNELSKIAMDIVRECKGLPLAIVVLGLALRDKRDRDVWNAILQQLQCAIPEDSMEKEVFQSIRYSYDNLGSENAKHEEGIQDMKKEVFQSIEYSYDYLESEESKLCFLFCCLFPEDEDIDLTNITRYMVGEGLIKFTETLDEARNQVSLLLDSLKNSGLLLEEDTERSVKMHDIVRDVAIWIAASDQYGFYSRPGTALKEWPRNIKTKSCQRISLQYNEISELPREPMSFPNLHTLLLNGNHNLEMIPEEFFSEMKALKVLDLSWTKIRSLPSSLSSLMNLKVLLLHDCLQLGDLSGIGALKSLEVLDLSFVDTRVLPTELGELSNLRSLDLSGTSCMIPSGVISQLTRLEELYVHRFDKWQPEGSEDRSHAEFAELAYLSRLRRLDVRIKDDRCFHQDLGHNCFQELKTFRILRSDYNVYIGDATRLMIVGSVVPDWAKLLAERADELALYDCPRVEFLHGGLDISITAFSNIKYLQLWNMKDLCRLCQMAPPDGFLTNLETLEVHGCDKLTNIFSSDLISRAHQLEELEVHHCAQLCHVFQYDSALGGESHDPILLPHLTTLYLASLPQLISIWEGGAPSQSLGNLREVFISVCDSLKHVFTWGQFRSLKLLEKLSISNCSGMVAIIMSDEANSEVQVTENNSNMLPRLKSLHLQHLEIASFDEEGVSLFDWPSLEKVSIECCPNLKKLPLSSHGAPGLREIDGSKEWFQALEWEDENIKSRLQSLFDSNDLEDTQDSTSTSDID